MFRSRRQTPKGSQTRIYVETNQALAGMLIAINDRPLTPEQQSAESNHLASLINNPEQLRKKAAREKEDEDRSLRIVKALPDAFCYEYAGTESSAPGLGKTGFQTVSSSTLTWCAGLLHAQMARNIGSHLLSSNGSTENEVSRQKDLPSPTESAYRRETRRCISDETL